MATTLEQPMGSTHKPQTVNLHIRNTEMENAIAIPAEESALNKKLQKLRLKNDTAREMISEFIATFLLVFLGDCVVATLAFTRAHNIGLAAAPLGWGLALLVALAVTGGASGCHANPAVTLAFASVGKLKWKKVLPYFLAQYVGAFVAAVLVFAVYYDSIQVHDMGMRQIPPHVNATAQIFATYTPMHVSIWAAFLDQVIATAILVLAVVAIIDPRNLAVHKGLYPVTIGFVLGAIVYALPYNCMAPLNPARDFSPRLFTLIAGYGTKVFSFRNHSYFMIPIIGPHVGGLLGVWIYKLGFDLHWPEGKNVSVLEDKSVGKSRELVSDDKDDSSPLDPSSTKPEAPLIHIDR